MPFEQVDEVETEELGVGRPDFTGDRQLVKTVGTVVQDGVLGTVQVIGNIKNLEEANIFGVDDGGTAQQIRVDSEGNLRADLVSGDIVAKVGTVAQIDNITNLGTITQIDTVNDIKSGSISQVERPNEVGTILQGTLSGSGTIGPQTITQSLTRRLTVGINTDTAMNISHEIKVGGQWIRDGSDTVPTEGLVTTISHNFAQYRAVRTDGGGDGTVTVTYEGRN